MIANFGHYEEDLFAAVKATTFTKSALNLIVREVASFLAMTNWMEKLERKTSFYTECPSPDRSGILFRQLKTSCLP
ncbi:hypothetical protein ASC72_22545 [Flavobacterium sp. Root420]|nr:hypothetical protein ASC72_22545 [Flavobacterium sp. Root420]